MISLPSNISKRKHIRICMDQTAQLSQGLYKEKVFLFDISLKGVCISLPTTFDLVMEYPCLLEFKHDKPFQKSVQMKIILVRKGSDKVGAYWKEIDINSLKRLASLIEYYSFKHVSLDDIKL